MSATVRCFFHSGVSTAPVAAGTKFATDSVALLKQPYLGRSSVTVDTGTPASTTAATAGTKMAHVQVQPGKVVHAEINPPNRSTAADTSSPMISGNVNIEFGAEWTISFLEATVS